MNSTNNQGLLGEYRAISEFIKYGADDIFTSVSGKSSVDFIVLIEGLPLKVEVKSCSYKSEYGKYSVGLKSVRPNRTKSTIRKFDGTISDILAIYLVQDDKVVFFNSIELDNRSAINIDPSNIEEYSLYRLLRDYTRSSSNTDDIVQTTTE